VVCIRSSTEYHVVNAGVLVDVEEPASRSPAALVFTDITHSRWCQDSGLPMPFLLYTTVDHDESKADPLFPQVHIFCQNLSCSRTLSRRGTETLTRGITTTDALADFFFQN
jgi:hypothetical protein